MNIHEFQAKQILRRFNVPVAKGEPASSPEEMAKAFENLGLPRRSPRCRSMRAGAARRVA